MPTKKTKHEVPPKDLVRLVEKKTKYIDYSSKDLLKKAPKKPK